MLPPSDPGLFASPLEWPPEIARVPVPLPGESWMCLQSHRAPKTTGDATEPMTSMILEIGGAAQTS
eukprot:8188829-Pyramimonas_sp.AAC.1